MNDKHFENGLMINSAGPVEHSTVAAAYNSLLMDYTHIKKGYDALDKDFRGLIAAMVEVLRSIEDAPGECVGSHSRRIFEALTAAGAQEELDAAGIDTP